MSEKTRTLGIIGALTALLSWAAGGRYWRQAGGKATGYILAVGQASSGYLSNPATYYVVHQVYRGPIRPSAPTLPHTGFRED